SLDPSRQAARVTREIAAQLAELAKSLEQKHSAEEVASFLMRCLFTMFAEDTNLIDKGSFTELLESIKNTPDHFMPLMQDLWKTMNDGGFSPTLRQKLLKFNGGLFADATALPLDKSQIELLIKSAKADWRFVEPAIFGTLLERALNPTERHKLGAHYTPRAYVERLVLPTVIEPLREEWRDVQAAAIAHQQAGKLDKAETVIRDFHHKLCKVRVLDPACGSGNFLYVCLEHMKRLEGEILTTLEDIGLTAMFDQEGFTVDPHQFLGIEINPRAAKIAEMVLWIGYLQWHFRTQGKVQPPEPVLRDFHNIENRDAVLAYDGIVEARDANGQAITQWDGKTKKRHPVTGKEVPDETARITVEKYVNPRKAEWPEADYVVGNPPFIGAGPMRSALGDGYVEALRKTWKEIPESSDFVMYWWHKAAELTREGQLNRFGFITTNSIKQTFNRRVVQAHLEAKNPLSLVFAIPDHPWVDSAEGASVRIAMTTACSGNIAGLLREVIDEIKTNSDEFGIVLSQKIGIIHANLKIGANLAKISPLKSNSNLCSRGVQLIGGGFRINEEEAYKLGYKKSYKVQSIIREYRNGKDLTQKPRKVYAIDLFECDIEELRVNQPAIFQWVYERVKPERDQNSRPSYRNNWWVFGEPRKEWRKMYADISNYVSTVETSKHRIFIPLEKNILPDNKLINIALDGPYYLGILSSKIHMSWALALGSILGPTPVYVKSLCFECYPFPDCSNDQVRYQISKISEQLDGHRKQQQAEHPDLTLTGMYNVLEKLRSGEALTAKEKAIHEQGLVSVLKEIHDELDHAVFNAYGWDDLAEKLVGLPGATTPLPDKPDVQAEAEEEMLKRLVDLNAQRAAEEAQGHIRWLRPEFQAPDEIAHTQSKLGLPKEEKTEVAVDAKTQLPWPKDLQEQIKAVREVLQKSPMDGESVNEQFKGKSKKKVEAVHQVLSALKELGIVNCDKNNTYSI
ncbi:MAG: class I SAM-dependent DNA methyltransferase, partial [Gammaproteobacteria bacterium]|nr:class I SAM-dependent DNA methyltransferase [Gammaproteobacteria bacterium]